MSLEKQLKEYQSLTPQDAKQYQDFTKVDWARWEGSSLMLLQRDYTIQCLTLSDSKNVRTLSVSLCGVHSIQSAVTRLFQMKRYPDLASELGTLNSKLRY